tara:strand:+ start:1752 stop:2132 length:381 start_codon:yes stop_codon:yes gene_type:complete
VALTTVPFVLIFYPQALFSHRYVYENFVIRTDVEIPPSDVSGTFQRVQDNLRASSLFDADQRHDVLYGADNRLFRFTQSLKHAISPMGMAQTYNASSPPCSVTSSRFDAPTFVLIALYLIVKPISV